MLDQPTNTDSRLMPSVFLGQAVKGIQSKCTRNKYYDFQCSVHGSSRVANYGSCPVYVSPQNRVLGQGAGRGG